MLFTLGLLLLLTPFPSFQSTTNEKKNSTGSGASKPNVVFTLSKPKTTPALPRQIIHPTLKPNTVNQTVLPTPATTKSKPSPAIIQTTPSAAAAKSAAVSGTITNKDKQTVLVNQTVLTKSLSTINAKATKDKTVTTGAPNVQSASTKSASASSAKATKDKLQPAVNQALPMKSPSISDGKTTKDKSISRKTTPTKNKPPAFVNQTSTGDVKNFKDKPASAAVQNVLSTPARDATAGGSNPANPIKVVISDGCESSNTKEQELKLKPGAPLVMTHKISLLPGGCSGGCESEMTALKERVARLEREMSALKDKCIFLSFTLS